MKTLTKTTAYIYIRVSTPAQQVDEQVRVVKRYADEHDIDIIGQYGDYQKRHKADKRRSFQAMLHDIEAARPSMILVQRLDRFGTADSDELGYFITLLKNHGVRLITAVDGKDRSKGDLETSLLNAVNACQSKAEQIDKSERVLLGKRAKARLGEYTGSKCLVYGFDVVCVGRDGREKWRLVDDAWDRRVKYVRDGNGEYVEADSFGNEIVKDPHCIMPDKEIRHRPVKDTSDRLFYSPSIRAERVDTLRRICEWADADWTSYRIAKQLDAEGIKPVYSDHWYSALIDGLLENMVLVGRPAWNRSSRSNFRHIERGEIVETAPEQKEKWRSNDPEEWYQPEHAVFDAPIPIDLFNRIQQKLEGRKQGKAKRSPRCENLWFGGLWFDEQSGLKLAGNSQGRHFRVRHPDHDHKKLSFKEAEWFIGEYLRQIGTRLETLGESVESKKLLERLSHEELMTELRLDNLVLQIESYLESRLRPGMNRVGDTEIVLDYDKDGNRIITTDGSYLEIYCRMVADDMDAHRDEVAAMMDERKRLAIELMQIKDKSRFLIDTYNDRIEQLSREIEEATSPPDFKAWWAAVQDEMTLLREKQEQVKQAVAQGQWIEKTKALRNLVDRIVCHWQTVPTSDRRHKSGFRTFCKAVTVHSSPAVTAEDGTPAPVMTIETATA